MTIRTLATRELAHEQLVALAVLFDAAYEGDLTDADWEHAMGGVHFLVEEGDAIIAHAAVVERRLETGGRALRTGFVEAVATCPERQRNGHGTAVLRAAGDYIRENFDLGALDTGKHGFYERLGWRVWRGPTGVRTVHGVERTPQEDGHVMVLFTPRTPDIDVTKPISCEWRPGDVW